ncbi:MAG: nucleolar RNA-binding Nop10p family protein [Thermoprotei archaeon]
MRCPRCGTYTLKDRCPRCGTPTAPASPPKFSPDDPYLEYKIRARKEARGDPTASRKATASSSEA